MYETDLLRASIIQVASPRLGNGWRVRIENITDPLARPVWETEGLHTHRDDAIGLVEDINDALKRATCTWCGTILAQYVEDFGNIETHPDDFTAWCADECRLMAAEEADALARAGL